MSFLVENYNSLSSIAFKFKNQEHCTVLHCVSITKPCFFTISIICYRLLHILAPFDDLKVELFEKFLQFSKFGTSCKR